MEKDLEEEINKNRFVLVRYGLLLSLIAFGFIIISMLLLKVGEESILSMVLKYYFRRSG